MTTDTSLAHRVRPDELVIRSVDESDLDTLDGFIGEDRLREMEEYGFALGDAALATPEAITQLAVSGVVRAWLLGLDGSDPLSFQIYIPSGFPGVWHGEGINSRAASGARGLGTAAMARSLNELFATTDARRVVGHVALSHDASLRMCEKLGFTREGVARQQLPDGSGGWQDAYHMALLKTDWRGSDHVG